MLSHGIPVADAARLSLVFSSNTILPKVLRLMQTDATSHNIVGPTMLGVVGNYCVVHANERNNCQHCWRSSKETMLSGTVIHKDLQCVCAGVFTRPTLWFHANGRIHCCATLGRSQNNRNVGTCCAKV